MDEAEVTTPVEEHVTFVGGHKFLVLVAAAIVISLFLTFISMELYVSSGASELDLSRPGYRSVSSQAISDEDTLQAYPSSGPVNKTTIDQFEAILNKQVVQINAVDAFSGDPLSPDALEISAPSATSTNDPGND